MADNTRKTAIVSNLNAFANQKNQDQYRVEGKALPCTVTKIISSEIIEVQFEVTGLYTLPKVTMPVATPEYVRLPIQKGDKGVAVPIDYYQGGVSGLGGGKADLSQKSNLGTHRFHPIGNTGWFKVDNDALVLYGPNGVVVMDMKKKNVITLTPSKLDINITEGPMTIEVKGDITITSKGKVTIKGSEVDINP